MSLWRFGSSCWPVSRTAQFDSKYTQMTTHGYCTVRQSCIMAQGMINGNFSCTDRLLVGNEDLSIQKWQGCSCWLILMCFLSLKLFPFRTLGWFSPPPLFAVFLLEASFQTSYISLTKWVIAISEEGKLHKRERRGRMFLTDVCTWLEEQNSACACFDL